MSTSVNKKLLCLTYEEEGPPQCISWTTTNPPCCLERKKTIVALLLMTKATNETHNHHRKTSFTCRKPDPTKTKGTITVMMGSRFSCHQSFPTNTLPPLFNDEEEVTNSSTKASKRGSRLGFFQNLRELGRTHGNIIDLSQDHESLNARMCPPQQFHHRRKEKIKDTIVAEKIGTLEKGWMWGKKGKKLISQRKETNEDANVVLVLEEDGVSSTLCNEGVWWLMVVARISDVLGG